MVLIVWSLIPFACLVLVKLATLPYFFLAFGPKRRLMPKYWIKMASLERPILFDMIYSQGIIVVSAASSSGLSGWCLLLALFPSRVPSSVWYSESLYKGNLLWWNHMQWWAWLRLFVVEFVAQWGKCNWLKPWTSFTQKSVYWSISQVCVCERVCYLHTPEPGSKPVTLITMGSLDQFLTCLPTELTSFLNWRC